MRALLVVIAGLVALASVSCADAARVSAPLSARPSKPAPVAAPPVVASGAIARLAERAKVGTDAGFAKMLAANQEDETMRAPESMRRALGVLTTHAMAIDARFEQKRKGFDLMWSATMRIDDHRAAIESIDRALAPDGFVRTQVGRADESWARGEEQVVAASAAASGHPSTFELTWTLVDAVGEGPFVARNVLAEAPWLRDARVDPRLYAEIADLAVLSMMTGATPRTALVRDEPEATTESLRRPTEWSIDALPQSDDDVARSLSILKAALTVAGFEWTSVTHGWPWDLYEYARDASHQRGYVMAANRDEADGWVARLVVESR